MRLPTLELQVTGWEIKELLEKDEEYKVVLINGKPNVLDAWVIVSVRVGTHEFPIEMELREFEKFVLPKALDPLIRFWQTVGTGHPLFPRREETMQRLLETKERFSLVET